MQQETPKRPIPSKVELRKHFMDAALWFAQSGHLCHYKVRRNQQR